MTEDDSERSDAPLSDLADELRTRRSDGDRRAEERPAEPAETNVPSANESDLEADRDRVDDADAGPLGTIAERVRERRETEDSETESPFESMDVGEVDSEKVWEEIFEEETEREKRIGIGADIEHAGGGRGYEEFIVDKAQFCEQCPHFGEPPDMRCTRDDTDIVEVVDSEHFRVRECPMVRHSEEYLSEL